MRIDFLITGLDYGGAEIQVVSLLERLKCRGHKVRIISLTPPLAFVDKLTAMDIPVISLNMKSAFDFPRALFKLGKLLSAECPDVLHGHMVHANIMARLSRLLSPKIRLVTTAHNTTEGGKLRDWVYRLTNPLSHLNTTVSESATRRFLSDKVFPISNTRTIFNGIDTERFSPSEVEVNVESKSQVFTWLAVGRLAEQKDYPTLLEAFSLLSTGKLLIAGKGPLQGELEEMVERLSLGERVSFLGVRNDVDELYRQVDGFVLSSAWEGYGLVVAEAMATSLPVVVTDSGGPGEIVGSGGNFGRLVPVRNHEALAAAMTEIMKMTTEERFQLGLAGRQRILNHFSLDTVVSDWENIYLELTSVGGGK
ncbi:glycosyltransferase [Oceanimonas pelagia]|uniref:Glycosyltransferase n=1 Tax=Oceanimonas pelagia TaxID=3028314 RepID=A0AA50QAY1_9GAMM|nr:glycosyltransferase [Oceanimonas pelagia]WMC11513.1 glycosyltransferase [Oceanimonas pelagia]